jgi:hypothetical protein
MTLLEDVKDGVSCHRSFRCFDRNVRPWLAYRQQMSSVIGLICVCDRIILSDTFEWVEEGENFAPRIGGTFVSELDVQLAAVSDSPNRYI